MSAEFDRREQLRSEGRARACEGIIRSRFGKRPTSAGTHALRRLRASENGFGGLRRLWSRSPGVRAAAMVAAVALLVLALAWALISSSQVPDRNPIAETNDGQEPDTNITDKTPEPRQKPSGNRAPGAVQVVDRGMKPNDAGEKEPEAPEQAPEPGPQEQAVLASVGHVSGDVKVRHKDGEEWEDTKALLSILPGDTVKTDSAGKARLDLDEGDYVCLNADAEVTVEKDSDEFLFKLGRGEIFVDKASVDGSMAVETGFGRVRSRGGRFNMQKCGEDKYLLHVLDGEVECHERGIDHTETYGSMTLAYFERGKPCDRGTEFGSDEAFAWAASMRPKQRPRGPGRRPGPGRHGPPRSGGTGKFLRMISEKFGEFDKNGDGKLSAEEARFPDRESWDKFIKNIDADGDGELSSAECKAVLDNMKERKGPGRRGRGGPREEDETPEEGK